MTMEEHDRLSLSKRPTKRKSKKAKSRFKSRHKNYRSKSEDKGKPPQVFNRRGDGYLTDHLFEGDEQELRDSLKLLEVEIRGARRRSAKKKRLKNYHKIVSDRLVSLGYSPFVMTKHDKQRLV